MIEWYVPPAILTMVAIVTACLIGFAKEDYCELLAASFVLLCAPVLAFFWLIFYLLSFIL